MTTPVAGHEGAKTDRSFLRSPATCAAAMLALQATACFSRQVLPARTQPSRDRPSIAIEPGPPPPGTGRVVLDSTDGPTEVQEVVAYASGEAYGARGFGFASAPQPIEIIAVAPGCSHSIISCA